MLEFFGRHWREVPTCWIDYETTGTRIGVDRAVQVGLARFEGGVLVRRDVRLVCPGVPIPAEATAIHGITNADVDHLEDLATVLQFPSSVELIAGAQPSSYNAPFDREFCPPGTFDRDWPWLDCLSIVRHVDKYERGKGRHRLAAACERHGIALPKAHDAGADAEAAGNLFYKLAAALTVPGKGSIANWTLGQLLCWQGIEERHEWYRFNEWRAKQPPQQENASA